GVEGRRGDRAAALGEHRADQLDPVVVAICGGELHQYRGGRSSSAAKKADADFKISFARRNSAFSFFNTLICSCSAVVRPGRCPASTSARRIHVRSVSADRIPNFLATASIAANSDG